MNTCNLRSASAAAALMPSFSPAHTPPHAAQPGLRPDNIERNLDVSNVGATRSSVLVVHQMYIYIYISRGERKGAGDDTLSRSTAFSLPSTLAAVYHPGRKYWDHFDYETNIKRSSCFRSEWCVVDKCVFRVSSAVLRLYKGS